MSQGEFHVWHGNVTVIPTTPEAIATIGKQKFDGCEHRSPTEETKIRQTCCGSKKQTGYKCKELGIFGVTPDHCANCNSYSQKNSQT